MYIESIKIRNYRTLSNLQLDFNENSNVIIGENEAGKTSIINIMRNFFDKNASYHNIRFKEGDFSHKLKDLINDDAERSFWQGHWIMATVLFRYNLDETSKDISILEFIDESCDASQSKQGSIHCFFRPKEAFRKSLYSLNIKPLEERKSDANKILAALIIEDYEVRFYAKNTFDISNDLEYKNFVGDFDNYIFPNPNEENFLVLKKENLYENIDFTFIDYKRDESIENRKSPFYKSIGYKLNELKSKSESWEEFKKIIFRFNSDIDKVEEFKTLSGQINNSIEAVIKGAYNNELSIKSNFTNDTTSIARALGVIDKNNVSSDSFSLGILNILYISLIFLNAELDRERNIKKGNLKSPLHILIIEEPESHLHVHLQKTLFNTLYRRDVNSPNEVEIEDYPVQVFMTTHSVHLSEAARLTHMNIIKSEYSDLGNKFSKSYSPIKFINESFTEARIKRIERYLDVKRSELLFANGVVLVEGDAEQILIPIMFRNKFNLSLDELGVSLVSVNSAVFDYIAELFGSDRIQKRCSIITDLDSDNNQTIDVQGDDVDAEEFQDGNLKFANLNSRLKLLNAKYENNDYVNIYVTKEDTFECDLALYPENIIYVKALLDEIYVNSTSKQNAKNKLDDCTTASKELLRISKKVGKGWFALMLAEKIDEKFIIPDYILNAVLFAAEESLKLNIEGYFIKMNNLKELRCDENIQAFIDKLLIMKNGTLSND